jgi:hypothetical protein
VIKKIIVVGGGSAGWMSASSLVKAFPDMEICVVESKDVPIIGVGESWAKYVGLKEERFFEPTNASIKMSIKFTDFYKKDSGGFHYPFGKPFFNDSDNPYYTWQLKKYYYPETPITDFVDCLFPAASLFQTNKYSLNKYNEFDNFNPDEDIAYHFDAVKFGNWLREEFCIPKGVKHIIGTVKKVNTGIDGITSLILDDGSVLTADLFVDCTGFKSLLLGESLSEPFEPYSHMLPNNKAWAARLEYKDQEKELEGFTNSTAIQNGWCWNIPLFGRLGSGYVYSDLYTTSEDAQKEFKSYLMSSKMVVPRTRDEVENLEFKDITMRVGIHTRTFVKNVVAIGLSAGFIEPLESNGLFSVHEFLVKLVAILRRRHISQFDRDMYNTVVRNQFDNFAKFVAMHYALSHRSDTEYWKANNDRSYQDRFGDPYFPYLGRSDAFWNMAWRYMENWHHPYDSAGIPFISTGMDITMFDDYRIERTISTLKRDIPHKADLKKLTDFHVSKWESNKVKWSSNALKAPTLYNYLKTNFYS